MRRRAFSLGAAAALAILVACGSDASSAPKSKADWMARHGTTVAAVGTALDQVENATKGGDPTAIRTMCQGLRDATQEARALPAVPDAASATALTEALDAIRVGAADCTQATSTGDTRLLERSITELRDARLKLDTANARLNQ